MGDGSRNPQKRWAAMAEDTLAEGASIENARLYEDAARRAEQMRLLVELGQRLNAILDLDSLLKAIVIEVQATLRCRLVALGLVEGDRLRFGASATPEGLVAWLQNQTMSLDAGLCGWVARNRQALRVADVRRDPRYYWPQSIPDIGTRSEIVVPVQLGRELLGVLNAESEEPGAFDAQDEVLLVTVANQAAVAISNARRHAQAEQRAATLRALLRTTRELNTTLDLRQLLEIIAQQARTLIDVDSCIIFLLNPETGILSPVIALDPWADHVLGLTLKLGEGITGRVALHGVGEIVNRADQDPGAVKVPGTPIEPESLLVSPLLYKGRVIGVMTLSRLGEREFLPADLELLNSFASQAANAVENARLYTESRRRARQLEQTHARLERAQNQLLQAEKLSAIGQLAAGMAHELNNPLTAIMGFAQLLESEGLSAAGRADVRRILAAAGRAQKIVANLLTFARQQRIAPQPVDLTALVERILRLYGQEAGAGHPTIRQELAANLPEAHVDPVQFEQLVLHLLRNAHRAMSQVGGGTITVRLDQAGDRVRLEVADEGPGIPNDLLPHIFDPFFATGERGEGQGLGLAACFGIVRAHNGHIWAEPRPGGGTRFTVELPLDMAASQTQELLPADCSVLIVTEDETLAEALLSIMDEMGQRPSWVESAEAALAEVVVQRYDLILCDVRLPGMGIAPLYETIGANYSDVVARFVAIGEGAALPAVPVIPTPVEASRVREIVRACLSTGAL